MKAKVLKIFLSVLLLTIVAFVCWLQFRPTPQTRWDDIAIEDNEHLRPLLSQVKLGKVYSSSAHNYITIGDIAFKFKKNGDLLDSVVLISDKALRWNSKYKNDIPINSIPMLTKYYRDYKLKLNNTEDSNKILQQTATNE